ncbi:MAG: EAL domain-containing protein [Sulfuritalea sp.]|nr:EAL domain-containing protein [Sulfuritalea sp.]
MTATDPAFGNRRRLVEWLFLLGALLGLGSYLGYSKYQEHGEIEAEEQTRLASQAEVIEKNVVPQLLLSNRVIEGILKNIPSWRAENDRFQRANRELKVINDAMLGIRPILVIQADGTVIASSNETLVGMNFFKREYFQTAINNPDPAILHVSAPFKTVLDTFVVSLFRTIAGPDGVFAGIVIVSVEPEYFSTLLDSVRYTPDMRTSIAHGDGKLLQTSPLNRKSEGTDLATPGSFFTRHRDSGQVASLATGKVYVTGDERMMALRTIRLTTPLMDKSLVVAVSRDLEPLFAAWRTDLRIQSTLFGVIAVFGTLGLAFIQRRRRALFTERDLAAADQRIAAMAFESQQGMMVTDPEGRILRVNRAFTEITGYTAAEVVGQTPHLLQSGRHNADFYRSMWKIIKSTGQWQGEVWDRRKNGEVYPKWLTISTVKADDGTVTHYIGAHFDISERKKAEETINTLAFFDQLTALPNRILLLDRLNQAMTASSRSGSYGALLFINLDKFKVLNDTLGRDKGDLLLQDVAQRLTASVREGDTVARVGGDEFVVVLGNLSRNIEEAATQTETVGMKILAALEKKYLLGDIDYGITASIGATMFRGHNVSVDKVLTEADLAMHEARETGRNTLRFFDPVMQTVVVERAALEADLREAIENNQFLLHYQAQVVGDGRLTGAEVLVRWQHPERGMVSPADFIPLAEETGLILPLGHWVLETACRQLALWAIRPEMACLTLAVNVSAHQFRLPYFVDEVLAVLKDTGANPQRLKLELTESLLVTNVGDIIEKMFALKARGVGFSLDDFGTGYSSLSYLKRLPLDQLKIDQSFVRDVLSDPNDAAIARTVVALARSLGLGVIAEGVETALQRDFLASVGCHAYQGYFFSRPLSIESFEEFAQRAKFPRASNGMTAKDARPVLQLS